MSKSKQFKQEMIALITHYRARFHEGEHYDQDENPIGETEYIIVDGEWFTLADFFPNDLQSPTNKV